MTNAEEQKKKDIVPIIKKKVDGKTIETDLSLIDIGVSAEDTKGQK